MVPCRSRWLGVTLSTAATVGLAVISSSWKLLSSITTISSGAMRGRTSSSTSPMLPPTWVVRPDARHIAPASAVVVVLPALPVMPSTGAGHRSRNNWASLVTATPRRKASCTIGSVGGTPPLTHSTSQSSSSSRGCPPSANCTGVPANSATLAASASALRVSDSVTRAPRVGSQRPSALPWRAIPNTTTCFPASGSGADFIDSSFKAASPPA